MKTREAEPSGHWEWATVRNIDRDAKKDWKFSVAFTNAEVKEMCAKSTEIG